MATPGFRYPGSRSAGRRRARPTTLRTAATTLQSVRKLKEKRTSRAREAQMQAIGDALAAISENRFKTATVIPLQQRLTGSLEATLWVLMSAVNRLAHWVREYREPPAGAGRGQDARDRAARRARPGCV